MVIHLKLHIGKHLQLGCLLIIFFISIFSCQKIYGQWANIGIGIVKESGGIDTIGPGTQPEFAYILCKKQCYKFLSLDYTNDPTQGSLIDTFIWDFKKGIPTQTTSSSPTICFNDTSSLMMLSLQRAFILYVQGEPPAKIWYNQIFYVKVLDCIPVANFTQTKEVICPNQTISFIDSSYRNPETWEWEFQGGYPSSWSGSMPPEIKYNNPGLYQVTLSVHNNEGGDTLVKLNTVEVINGPIRNGDSESNYTGLFGKDTIIHSCAKGDTYQWIPSEGLSCDDCESPIMTFGKITEYTSITWVNDGACSDSCIVEIRTEKEEPKIFFPNVISPNYDGVNDVFEGSWSNAEIQELHIYDRWGGVKYSSNTNFTWDGTYKGQEVGNGVYVYYVVFKNVFTDKKEVKSGSVTLFR